MTQPPDLKNLSEADKDKLIVELFARIEELMQLVSELKGKLSLNSGNSGKPPSTDGFNKPKETEESNTKNTSTRE